MVTSVLEIWDEGEEADCDSMIMLRLRYGSWCVCGTDEYDDVHVGDDDGDDGHDGDGGRGLKLV